MTLIDAIGKTVFIFEGKQYTDDDFEKMSSGELATFKAKVNLRVTNIADIITDKRKFENMKQITGRQRIESFIKQHGYSPTHRDIGKHFQISVKAAFDNVFSLIKKGYIETEYGKARTISIKKRLEVI